VFSRISIRTRLSPEQAADAVRELIRPEGFLGGLAYAPSDPRPFIGRSKDDQFKFRRRVVWHNSFQPIIIGRVRAIPHGAAFEYSIRLDLFVMLLVPVIFGMMGFEAAKELHEYIQTSGAGGGYGLFVFLTLFGGFGVVSYRYESRKAERILHEALERKGGVLPNPDSA
jgi:hypothetical protein